MTPPISQEPVGSLRHDTADGPQTLPTCVTNTGNQFGELPSHDPLRSQRYDAGSAGGTQTHPQRSTEQRRGHAPGDHNLTDDARRHHSRAGSDSKEATGTGTATESGQRAGPTESAKVGDQHHREAEPDSDKAFIAVAASARRTRLRHESSMNQPSGPLDFYSPIGTIAAERVRIILCPGTQTARNCEGRTSPSWSCRLQRR